MAGWPAAGPAARQPPLGTERGRVRAACAALFHCSRETASQYRLSPPPEALTRSDMLSVPQRGARHLAELLSTSGSLPGVAAGWIAWQGVVGGVGCECSAAHRGAQPGAVRGIASSSSGSSGGGKRGTSKQQQQQQQQRQRKRVSAKADGPLAGRSVQLAAWGPGSIKHTRSPGSGGSNSSGSGASGASGGGGGGGGGGSKLWGLLGPPEVARRRIRRYTLAVLFAGVPILGEHHDLCAARRGGRVPAALPLQTSATAPSPWCASDHCHPAPPPPRPRPAPALCQPGLP
jgi:hypothetical protein